MAVRRAGREEVRTIFCSMRRRERRERRVVGSRVTRRDQWVETLHIGREGNEE